MKNAASILSRMLNIGVGMCPQSNRSDVDVDVDAIIATLEDHPVRYAVLYGSHVHGAATAQSDIDIAVAFADSLSKSERFDCQIALIVDLTEALRTDDVDLADLDKIRPEVGLHALETGQTLIEDREARQEFCEQFEREAASAGTHEERMRRFDAILHRLEETI